MSDIPSTIIGFPHEQVSHFMGYISVFFWFIVFIPQIYENYKRQSGDSIALSFLLIWIIGDVLNLAGVIFQDLLFTMLVLSIYYCASDTVLISQVIYYRLRSPKIKQLDGNASPVEVDSSTSALPVTEATALLPSAEDRNSALPQEDETSTSPTASKALYLILPLFILGAGFITFHESIYQSKMGVFLSRPPPTGNPPRHIQFWPQVLGWTSASLYVFARIPQIWKNYRSKSCEGLSLAMFAFCVLGNVTFCLSIFTYSLETEFLLMNLPWLVGNGGTLVFDFTIFYQFWIYRPVEEEEVRSGGEVMICPQETV
ncbi:PQ loop repeat-domain-containing protein [Piptocephalis cylindrospora]|uniref:PQ loop repeat-domain-containing protein n=1 Tax=Piptocephalis cylindrospora TaxID=1907219 RepID=A0A4P9XZW4_9FUNG|nr:PQ loop repeat-domain-containing protein [Piptocephalis cylindrospora]|eukprot:RKP12048.1 PQ loop repeat-domain-containing protein [Piptocephalis cylindrospora]